MLDVFKYDIINDVYINETPLEAINTKYHEGVIAFSHLEIPCILLENILFQIFL